MVNQLEDVYSTQFQSLTRILEVPGSLNSAAIQETCLKVGISFELFIQASPIHSWKRERMLSGGTFSYLGWITANRRLINWAKVEQSESHLLCRKGNRIIFTCLHPLQTRIYFPVLLTNVIPSSKGSLSCVAGGSLEGRSFCDIYSCKVMEILGDSRNGLGPFFIRSWNPSTVLASWEKNLSWPPPNNPVSLDTIAKDITHKLDYFSGGHLPELLLCYCLWNDWEKICPEILFHFHEWSYYGVTF